MTSPTSRVAQIFGFIRKTIDEITPEEVVAAQLPKDYFDHNESTAGAFLNILVHRDPVRPLPHKDDLKAAIIEAAQTHQKTLKTLETLHEMAGRPLEPHEQEEFTALLQKKDIQEAIEGCNPVKHATEALERREQTRKTVRQENLLARAAGSHSERAQTTGGKKGRQA